MRNLAFLFLIFVCSAQVMAQRYGQFTSYIYNKNFYNPAYTAVIENLTGQFVHRNQWNDFKGAPVNILMSVQSPIATKNVGIGFSVLSERIGAWNNLSISSNFSYKVQFKEDEFLSFGLSVNMDRRQVAYHSLRADQGNDLSIGNQAQVNLNPNFGTGAFYNKKNFYVGYSMPRLLNFRENKFLNFDWQQMHHFFMAGKIFPVRKGLKLHAATMLSFVPNVPFEFNLTGAFILMERLQLGINYRHGASVDMFTRYQVNNKLSITVAYDVNTSATMVGNLGSTYEFMLEYQIPKGEKENINTGIRYF